MLPADAAALDRAAKRERGIHQPYKIAGIAYPWRLEQSHTMLIGTTGAGKTTQLRSLVKQLRERGHSAVIFDLTGAFVESFYNPETDVILNPMDQRCRPWTIFNDCDIYADFLSAATALIPSDPGDKEPFWQLAARTLFVEICIKLKADGETSNAAIAHHLMTAELKRIHAKLEDTVAAPLTTEKAARMKASPAHVEAAANHWLSLPKDERDATALFASGSASRAELNERVQAGLKADGTLAGEGRTFSVIERVNTTREELRYAKTYAAGQTLEVARAVSELGLRRGTYEVIGVDAKGRVELRSGSKTLRFDPQKIDPMDKRDALGLSQRESIKLHENDQIRWTQNDKDRGLLNAALARVVSVSDKGVTVEAADKTLHELKTGDPMLERMGLAYALNMHMAQGITADKGIAVMSSTESNLSNQRLFNVTVTRVRDDLTLYTDNKDRLTSAIERNEGNKTSALETVGQLEVDKAPQRQSGPASPSTPFNPALPPELDRKAMDLTQLRLAVEPRAPDLPFPEKDIGLEL